MANPNIVGVTSIYGKVAGQAVTTSATAIVSNASSSGKVYKINSLTVSNVNGTTSADVTVDVYKNATTAYRLASTIAVPADASIVIISRENSIYLEENDALRLTASVDSYLEAVVSYEEISSS